MEVIAYESTATRFALTVTQKISRDAVAGGIAMQFAFICHAMLGNQLSGHIWQKVGAVEHLALRNQANTAKNRALLVVNAGFEARRIGVEVDADPTRCQTARCANAYDTGIPFDERQLI